MFYSCQSPRGQDCSANIQGFLLKSSAVPVMIVRGLYDADTPLEGGNALIHRTTLARILMIIRPGMILKGRVLLRVCARSLIIFTSQYLDRSYARWPHDQFSKCQRARTRNRTSDSGSEGAMPSNKTQPPVSINPQAHDDPYCTQCRQDVAIFFNQRGEFLRL
jgi:hypothetical protein